MRRITLATLQLHTGSLLSVPFLHGVEGHDRARHRGRREPLIRNGALSASHLPRQNSEIRGRNYEYLEEMLVNWIANSENSSHL